MAKLHGVPQKSTGFDESPQSFAKNSPVWVPPGLLQGVGVMSSFVQVVISQNELKLLGSVKK